MNKLLLSATPPQSPPLARGRAAGVQAVGNRTRRHSCAAMRYTGNDLLIVRDHISARRSDALLVAPTMARRRPAASDSIGNPVPKLRPAAARVLRRREPKSLGVRR